VFASPHRLGRAALDEALAMLIERMASMTAPGCSGFSFGIGLIARRPNGSLALRAPGVACGCTHATHSAFITYSV
jgi:hypothetical protein